MGGRVKGSRAVSAEQPERTAGYGRTVISSQTKPLQLFEGRIITL